MSARELENLLAILPTSHDSAGHRLTANPALDDWLRRGTLARVIASLLGAGARPIRAILFNKSEDTNWALGWHQDRTIAVKARADLPGFGPWTLKSGILHVEPPFALIESMVTARIHIDAVDALNAPLLAAPGSHRQGRIKEADIDSVVAQCGTTACLASATDIWLYRTAILHASDAMRRSGTRRVLQVDFSAEALPPPLEWQGIS